MLFERPGDLWQFTSRGDPDFHGAGPRSVETAYRFARKEDFWRRGDAVAGDPAGEVSAEVPDARG